MRGTRVSSTTIILALLAMAVIALADLSLKLSAGKISPSLGTLIYAATSIVIPLAWAAWTKRTSGLNASVEGVCWSVAVGLLFSVFTGLMFVIFSRGVELSVGSPAIRMGGIVLAAILGIVVFREGITFRYLAGFALTAVGVFLVVTR